MQPNYDVVCSILKTLGPSAIDLEMRLLVPYGITEGAYNEEIGKHDTSLLRLALWFFVLALGNGDDFDIIQA